MSKNTSSENLILSGNIYRGIVSLSLPLMLLGLINTAYTMADTFFVGRIDELAVGAVSLVAPIVGCANACIVGLCAAAVALISRAIGEKNSSGANSAARNIMVLGCLMGLIIGFLILILRRPILEWLETPEEIYDMAGSYLAGIAFDFLFGFILSCFQSIKQAEGNTKIGAVLNIISCLLNCLLDPLFIFVFDMGTFGAAIATLLSKALICPVAIVMLMNKNAPVHLEGGSLRPDRRLLGLVVKISIPAAMGQLLSSLGFVFMAKDIVSYGAVIMSAYGIGNQISSLFGIPNTGTGSALTTFIGQNLGNKNPERCRECFRKTMLVTLVFSVILTVLGFFGAPAVLKLFVKNASGQLTEEALTYSYYSIFTSFFMGWFMNLLGVFNGSGNTLISMILSTCRLFAVRIPVIYFFKNFTDLQHIGIWMAMIISNLIICIAGEIIYLRFPWTERGVKL